MKYIKIYLLIGAICVSSSCKDMLDTEPRQSISSDIALTTTSGVGSLLNYLYAQYRAASNYGANRIIQPEVLADNVINTSTNNNTWRTQETNQPGTGTGNWINNYNIINSCNLIIDAVDQGIITDASAAQANLYKGEATFFRALAYFQLATSYGYLPGKEVGGFKLSVPLILSPTKTVGDVTYPTRNTNTEVYAQIKADLTTAISLLNNTARSGKQYISKAAAEALLSRVCLYTDDWAGAISNATSSLGATTVNGQANTVTTTGAALVAMWRQATNKTEAIWEIAILDADNPGVGSLQSWFSIAPKPVNNTCSGNPTITSRADLTVPTSFLNQYDPADIRRTQLIAGPYCKGTINGYYYSDKYSGTGGKMGLDNPVVLRTSELVLNRAEANARLGNSGPAVTDLNLIRTRAGIGNYTYTTQAALITEILKQRRLELAFEGHRWFDLIRNQMDIPKADQMFSGTTLIAGLNTNGTVIPYNDRRILAPIPAAQIDANKNLAQNPGY